jgi:hypothetical protein
MAWRLFVWGRPCFFGAKVPFGHSDDPSRQILDAGSLGSLVFSGA